MLKVFGFLTLFLLGIILTPLALAGGAGVYATTYATEDPHWNIVRVYFDAVNYQCRGIKVTFAFDNPEEGDVISGTDGGNSSTITEDANYETVDGKQYLRCHTYTKVYSKELKWNRTFNISFTGSTEGSRQIAVSFGLGLNDSHISLLPWEGSASYAPPTTPKPTQEPEDNTINLWLLNQKFSDSGIRQALIKWGAFGGRPTTSKIYGSTDKNNWELLLDNQRGPSATVSIKTKSDYYIKVNGCVDKVGTCVDSNILLLPKIQNNPKISSPKPTQIINPSPTSSPLEFEKPKSDMAEKLNQKIASLEAKLAESQKQQSVLEQRINALINFIKSLFPFFR